jgi:hypothetical protein
MSDDDRVDAAWNAFDQMRAERAELERQELYDAEARWLSFEWLRRKIGPAANTLTWAEHEAVAPKHYEVADGHVCSPRTCSHESCDPAGRAFRDPATGVVYHASGAVYVCRVSGQRHVCDDACSVAEVDADGTVSCPISGRFFGGHIDNREGFNHHETASLRAESESFQHATMPINVRAKRARAAKAARVAAAIASGAPPPGTVPRLDAAPANNHLHEADRVVTRLVCSGAIREALRRRIADEDTALAAELLHELSHGRRPNAVELIDMAVAHIPPGTASALRVLEWSQPMPLEAPAYLRGCVLRMFALVRATPGGIDGGKDINLGKMCVPLMYVLMRGLVGVVDRRPALGKVERRVEHDTGGVDDNNASMYVTRYVFVPAHPCLSVLLPEEPALPPMDAWAIELGNLMKRTRRLEQCYLSTLEDAASEARDPAEYCLERYISPMQPDVLYDA